MLPKMASPFPIPVTAAQVSAFLLPLYLFGFLFFVFFSNWFFLFGFNSFVWLVQVGTYFVGQYYQVLQQQPDFVHQFYSDASTMLRIDGDTRETATAMLVCCFFFPRFCLNFGLFDWNVDWSIGLLLDALDCCSFSVHCCCFRFNGWAMALLLYFIVKI